MTIEGRVQFDLLQVSYLFENSFLPVVTVNFVTPEAEAAYFDFLKFIHFVLMHIHKRSVVWDGACRQCRGTISLALTH